MDDALLFCTDLNVTMSGYHCLLTSHFVNKNAGGKEAASRCIHRVECKFGRALWSTKFSPGDVFRTPAYFSSSSFFLFIRKNVLEPSHTTD